MASSEKTEKTGTYITPVFLTDKKSMKNEKRRKQCLR
jgi:hypothetical protein